MNTAVNRSIQFMQNENWIIIHTTENNNFHSFRDNNNIYLI